MTIYSLTSIDLLMVLGLAAAFPAVVGGILGIYFHGRNAPLHRSPENGAEEIGSAMQALDRKRPVERDGKQYMSLTEALEPSVVKMTRKMPRNSRPGKAA